MEDYKWLKNILEHDTESMTDKQKAIIKAAVELFSEKGYADTSTREIANKAGVAEGTIFKQYPTKKDLMLWINELIIKKALFPVISSGIDELLSKPFSSRQEFLSAFLQNRMSLIQESLPLFKIIFQEIPFHPEIRIMLIEQVKKMPFTAITQKLFPTEKSGSFKSSFSETEVQQIILTCISGFFFLRNIMMPELFSNNRLKKDAEILMRFINQGLYTKGESL